MKFYRIKIFMVLAVVRYFLFDTTVSFAQHKTEFVFRDFSNKEVCDNMQNNANRVFEKIHQAYFNDNDELVFSPENITKGGAEEIKQYWGNSHFYCSKAGLFVGRVLQTTYGYEVRNIPIYIDSADNKNREIVLSFDKRGTITGFNYALNRNMYTNVMNKIDADNVTNVTQLQIIIHTIEQFETAYNTKDIDFLEKIYSDDALIITGNVISKTTADGVKVQEINYKSSSKKDYLNKLREVFKRNAWINISLTFDGSPESSIVQHVDYPEMYGVSLFQKWDASGGYHDEGYLFLLFDFEDINAPKIWVRNWLAAFDDKGNPVNDWDKYSLDDVRIKK